MRHASNAPMQPVIHRCVRVFPMRRHVTEQTSFFPESVDVAGGIVGGACSNQHTCRHGGSVRGMWRSGWRGSSASTARGAWAGAMRTGCATTFPFLLLPAMSDAEFKEAFALFDKRGTGSIPSSVLGDLLRALGQNPTQGEVAELVSQVPPPGDIDYPTFISILQRPNGFKPAGTPDEFIRGFQVFDKEGNGFIGAGELRYVLTSLGEKLSDEEVDELLKGVPVSAYVKFHNTCHL